MKHFWKKPVSALSIILLLQTSLISPVQAAPSISFWQFLSANIFGFSVEGPPEGLFLDWEASFPENATNIAFQNSEGLVATIKALESGLRTTAEEAGETEEGAIVAMFAGIYLGFLEGLVENASRVYAAEIHLQYDPEALQDFMKLYESSVRSLNDPSQVPDFGALGICGALTLEAEAPIIDRVAKELQSSWKDGDVSFSVTKEAEYLRVSSGCEGEIPSLLDDLPAEVNLVAYQSGFDYDAFFELAASTENRIENIELDDLGGEEDFPGFNEPTEPQTRGEPGKATEKIMEFYDQLRDINAQQVAEDMTAGAYLLSLTPGGHKIQTVASLNTPEKATLLKRYWAGKELKTPFFMNQKAGYDSKLLEFSGEDREYVFFEEKFDRLDWTHWYGQLSEISTTLLPLIATLGTIGMTSLGSLDQVPEVSKAEMANAKNKVMQLQTLLMVEQLEDETFAPTSKEDIEFLALENGLSMPYDDEVCVYYVRSLSQPSEFAVFTNIDPVFVRGTDKMAGAIAKIFTERELTCETPKIKGTVLLNLSQ